VQYEHIVTEMITFSIG